VISNPFSKADSSASAIAPHPFTKPPAGTPAGLQRPAANLNHPAPPAHPGDDMDLGGEMPELVVDENMDGPEAVIEAEPAEDLGFRPDPVTAPTPSSELRTPRLTPMPRREPASEEIRRPSAPPARPEPARQVMAEPAVERPASKSEPLAPLEAVIPLVLPKGSGSREVVIRIIVTEEDRAA
jgi:hypothetical protein